MWAVWLRPSVSIIALFFCHFCRGLPPGLHHHLRPFAERPRSCGGLSRDLHLSPLQKVARPPKKSARVCLVPLVMRWFAEMVSTSCGRLPPGLDLAMVWLRSSIFSPQRSKDHQKNLRGFAWCLPRCDGLPRGLHLPPLRPFVERPRSSPCGRLPPGLGLPLAAVCLRASVFPPCGRLPPGLGLLPPAVVCREAAIISFCCKCGGSSPSLSKGRTTLLASAGVLPASAGVPRRGQRWQVLRRPLAPTFLGTPIPWVLSSSRARPPPPSLPRRSAARTIKVCPPSQVLLPRP